MGSCGGSVASYAHLPRPPTLPTRRSCNLVVGPEGGFVDGEVDLLINLGFTPLSLGPRILPVETAVHVLLGKLCF